LSEFEQLEIAYQVMTGVGMLATLVVAVTALVVAVVLSVRKESIVAGWLLAVAWGAAVLLDVVSMLVPLLLGDALGFEMVRWSYVFVGTVNLLFGMLMALAFGLFRPREEAAGA
jgi:hypothetical protein